MFTPKQPDMAFAIAVPADLVQEWITNPASNAGLSLSPGSAMEVAFDLRSSESPYLARRPELVVTYLP
jgi:hypothetical protein